MLGLPPQYSFNPLLTIKLFLKATNYKSVHISDILCNNSTPPTTAGIFQGKKVWEFVSREQNVKTFDPAGRRLLKTMLPPKSLQSYSRSMSSRISLFHKKVAFTQRGKWSSSSILRKSNKHRIRSSTHHLIVVNFWNGPNHCIYNNVWRPVPVRL